MLKCSRMEERVETSDKMELIVQLVPETGESNYQYIILDHENHEALSIDCFDPKRVEKVIIERGVHELDKKVTWKTAISGH